MKNADATNKGFEITHTVRCGHRILRELGATDEFRFVDKLFRLPA